MSITALSACVDQLSELHTEFTVAHVALTCTTAPSQLPAAQKREVDYALRGLLDAIHNVRVTSSNLARATTALLTAADEEKSREKFEA